MTGLFVHSATPLTNNVKHCITFVRNPRFTLSKGKNFKIRSWL